MPTLRRLFVLLTSVRSRRSLLGLTLLLQAVVLAIGLAAVFSDTRHRVAVALQDRIVTENVKTAEGIAETMESMDLGEVACSTPGAFRAQKLVEGIHLPAGAFVCVLDENDKIVCHPDLKANPSLCGIDLRNMQIQGRGDDQLRLGEADRGSVLAGRTTFPRNGVHYVAAKYIPSIKARLLVQQPESGLVALGDSASSNLWVRAGLASIGILGLTGAVSFVLIRRHDRVLETINAGLEKEIVRRVNESMAARHALILGLAKLADFRDTDTGRHVERVCAYSEALAKHLALTIPEISPAWIDDLRLAASLHDIGKVGIADRILLKPGKLTPEEREQIQRHAKMGADTLGAIREKLGDDRLVVLAQDIAMHHHERWDGAGYPNGLRGEAIPLAARIVSLADVYDALTSARVYKAGMTHAQAAAILREGAGTQFDPRVVAAFDALEAEFERIRREMTGGSLPVLAAA